jgi:uncharacterized protein YegP (UPF0339 family)
MPDILSDLDLQENLLNSIKTFHNPIVSNHQMIATSEMYSSKQATENGIASVQPNGSTTDVRDKT